ncbi:MAG: Fe-S cluster assembly protein SufD, partial [Pirellulaceae bacterium]
MTIDMATPVEFTSAGFEAFLDSRTEPAWLTDLRRQAWRQFETQDWPASNQEEWLRTDLRPFKLARFGVALGAMPHVDVAGLLTAGVQLGGHSVAVNG